MRDRVWSGECGVWSVGLVPNAKNKSGCVLMRDLQLLVQLSSTATLRKALMYTAPLLGYASHIAACRYLLMLTFETVQKGGNRESETERRRMDDVCFLWDLQSQC